MVRKTQQDDKQMKTNEKRIETQTKVQFLPD